MNNMIERYVYDVTRRLPEKEREEVSQELTSSIYDMLSDEPGEVEIKSVLYKLGQPALLAEQYRANPKYLISPAFYDDYIRTLKWIMPLVGLIVLAVGAILGAINTVRDSMANGIDFFVNILSQGLSMGISGAVQAAVWTTVGFVIAERSGAKTPSKQGLDWKPEDLPPIPANAKNDIPLSDSITELVIAVFVPFLVVLLCMGIFPASVMISYNDANVYHLFAPEFLTACIPAIAMIALFSISDSIIKIIVRHWTPMVCATTILDAFVGMVVTLYLMSRPNILSSEFISFIYANGWWKEEWLQFMGRPMNHPLFFLVGVIVVICFLVTCGVSVYKMVKYSKSKTD